MRRVVAALALGVAATAVSAHKSSDAYLQFKAEGATLALRWDIALRDLDAALPQLDADGDRQITYGEYKAAVPAIDAYALAHLRIAGCRFEARDHALERRSDGTYAVLQLAAPCTLTPQTPIGYTLFDDVDPTHRGIAKFERPDGSVDVRLLDPTAAPAAPGTATSAAPAPVAPASFLAEGVRHIVTGYDHVLFLLSLLLPAVLRRKPAGGWRPVERPSEAFVPVAGIVTLFTVAHSITLGLAALKLVSLPSWFIEPAIAVTIMLAALDNLRPVFGRFRGAMPFLFGLIHGFGFAGALAELELPMAAFGWALLKFNLGLELGQLCIVALVTPLLFAARRSPHYRPWVLRGGSVVAIAVAAWWFVERIRPLWAG